MGKAADATAGALRTTVVGCGAAAQILYRKPLRRLERQGLLRVCALVDTSEARARALGAFFPGASIASDLEASLERTASELTLVLSPAHLHHRHSICALRRANHVLCEKPMADNADSCREMVAVAREANKLLAVGMIRRFVPAFAEFRQLLLSRRIGTVESFRYAEGRRFDWDVTTPAAFRDRSQGGTGVLFDIGPHAIDVLIWLFGVPRATAYADDGLLGVESNLRIELGFPGCSGSVQLSWDSPLQNELRVYGSGGEAVLRLDQFDRLAVDTGAGWSEIVSTHRHPADLRQPARDSIGPRLYTDAIFCQLIQVLRAIRLGEEPAVAGQAGADCVAVMEAALRLARPLEMTWLSPEHQRAQQLLHWTRRR